MVNLIELEKKLDEALANETSETLTEWLRQSKEHSNNVMTNYINQHIERYRKTNNYQGELSATYELKDGVWMVHIMPC